MKGEKKKMQYYLWEKSTHKKRKAILPHKIDPPILSKVLAITSQTNLNNLAGKFLDLSNYMLPECTNFTNIWNIFADFTD